MQFPVPSVRFKAGAGSSGCLKGAFFLCALGVGSATCGVATLFHGWDQDSPSLSLHPSCPSPAHSCIHTCVT